MLKNYLNKLVLIYLIFIVFYGFIGCSDNDSNSNDNNKDSCLSSNQCETDEICKDGKCIKGPVCTNDDDCANGFTCKESKCEALFESECENDDDCIDESTCKNGKCTTDDSVECTTNNECLDNFACIDNECIEQEDNSCESNIDCDSGKLCIYNECIEYIPDNDIDKDGLENALDNCPYIYNPDQENLCPVELESEPNNYDDQTESQTLNELPIVIKGIIDTPIQDDEGNLKDDFDFYKINALKGDLLRLDLVAARTDSWLKGFITIRSEYGAWGRDNYGSLGIDALLEVIIPKDGIYYIIVGDINNITNENDSGSSAHIGGSEYFYELHIGPLHLTHEEITINNEIIAIVSPPGTLNSYELNTQEGDLSIIETYAARLLENPSDLNTALYVLDSDNTILAYNNDYDADLDNTDSKIQFLSLRTGNIIVVVDYFVSSDDMNLNYSLFISNLNAANELEPNNNSYNAFPVATLININGTIDTPVTIEETNEITKWEDDKDWYTFKGHIGNLMTLSCSLKDETSIVDPLIIIGKLIDGYTGPTLKTLSINDNSDGLSSFAELLITDEEDYFAVVMDKRNYLINEEIEPVGGSEFKYVLDLKNGTLESTIIEPPFNGEKELIPGKIDFLTINYLTGEKVTINLLKPDGSDIEPILNIYKSDSYKLIDKISPIQFTNTNQIVDLYFVNNGSGFISVTNNNVNSTNPVYSLAINKNSFNFIEQVENESFEDSTIVTEQPIYYKGFINNNDDKADYYSFELGPGQKLSLKTIIAAGEESMLKNTIITLYRSTGDITPPLKLIDSNENNEPDSFLSAINDFSIPKQSIYYVKIEASNHEYSLKTGHYILFLKTESCVSSNDIPENGLIINELFVNVPNTGGDANNDGTIDSSSDKFVEIFNNTDQNIDLGGLILAGNNGFSTFACNTVIKKHEPLLIFNRGLPVGEFGYSDIIVLNGFLDFINTSADSIEFKRSDNTILDSVVIDNTITGQSVTRNPDITGTFVPHSQTMNSLLFSPGTKNSGHSFISDLSESEPNDTKEQATQIASIPTKIIASMDCEDTKLDVCTDKADWFSFYVLAGTKINIKTEAKNNDNPVDTYLKLFNSNSLDELAANDDISAENKSSLISNFEITEDGIFYIEVSPVTQWNDYYLGPVKGLYFLVVDIIL